MTPTGTKNGPRPVDRPVVRAGIVVAGAAVLSAAVIGVALAVPGGQTERSDGGDAHTAAPGCEVVSQEALDELLPGAVSETEAQGPLEDGEENTCVWVSTGESDGGSVRVELSVRFTDVVGENVVSGAERVADHHAALAPPESEEFFPADGVTGRLWPGSGPGTVEFAYPVDNLLVRVSYSGYTDSEPQDFTDARERALQFAEHMGASL